MRRVQVLFMLQHLAPGLTWVPGCFSEMLLFSVRGLSTARAISKFTKNNRKCLHRWIGLKNDRQGLPTCCLPDQILCPDGVQRNGSNADVLVILGTVVERELVFWGLARDIMFWRFARDLQEVDRCK